MQGILSNLVLLVFFSFLLIKATDILLINLKRLSSRTRLGEFAITGFLIALATSLPELFVGISSALEGVPNLSLGNVIGSNIANLSLVIGGAAFLGGALGVKGRFVRRDVFYAFLAGAAPMMLLVDRHLSRIDGVILLALYGFYNFSVFAEQKKRVVEADGEKVIHWILRRLNHAGQSRDIAWIFMAVALLIFSSDMLVRQAVVFGKFLQLPILLIGLFLVAVGTSLPELAFQLKAVRQRRPQMAFGDLLGSVVANGTLIIGVTSLLAPIKIMAFSEYLLATLAYVVIFGLFYLFIRTKQKLERWEGAILVLAYLVFVVAEFL